jgi:hypothetical protein
MRIFCYTGVPLSLSFCHCSRSLFATVVGLFCYTGVPLSLSLVSSLSPSSLSLSISVYIYLSLSLSLHLSHALSLSSIRTRHTHRAPLHKQNLRGDNHELCRVAQPRQPHRKHPAIRRQELAGGGRRGYGAVVEHDSRARCPQAAGLAVSAVVQWARAEAACWRIAS